MRAALVLLGHSARRVRILVAGTGLVLGIFQVLASAMAASFAASNSFPQVAALVPAPLREVLGPSLLAAMSFSGIVLLGYFHFAVIGFLVGLSISIATEPAAEIESGFNDLLMARPIARTAAITRSALLHVAAAAITIALMLGGTWLGLALFAPAGAAWPAPGTVTWLAVELFLLMFCWGGIALAVAAGARRRGVAGATAGLAALALFLLDVAARFWQPARALAWLSPFHYYDPLEAIVGRTPEWSNLAVLAVLGLAGIAVAQVVYARRDL
jgi:ABC-2 type transport system permease protein